jgi:hypothetical protein
MRDFPHDRICGSKDSPIFYGHADSVVKQISAFIEYYKKNDFLHEDVMAKYFFMSLKGFAKEWFESLGKGMFASFAEFLEAFCARWDHDSAGWLPLVREIKGLYDAQNIIEEDPGPPMEDGDDSMCRGGSQPYDRSCGGIFQPHA